MFPLLSQDKDDRSLDHFLLELLEFEYLNRCPNLYLQYQLHPRIICSLIS